MIITLDGPAGSGKSTIARLLAKELNFEYIDSGALYRTLTLMGLRLFGAVETKADEVAQFFKQHPDTLEVRFEAHRQIVKLEGKEVTQEIRDPELTKQIRHISGHGPCRDLVNLELKKLARLYPVVVDGRDIGSVVFPESKNKFYLDASPRIRAQRRALEQNTPTEGPAFEALVKEINDRDQSDQSRPIAPLVRAADAHLIDTSGLSLEQVLGEIKKRLVSAP